MFTTSQDKAHLLVQGVLKERVKRSHGALVPNEEVRVGAESIEDASQLHGNVSRSHNSHARRLVRQGEEAIAVPRSFRFSQKQTSLFCDTHRTTLDKTEAVKQESTDLFCISSFLHHQITKIPQWYPRASGQRLTALRQITQMRYYAHKKK